MRAIFALLTAAAVASSSAWPCVGRGQSRGRRNSAEGGRPAQGGAVPPGGPGPVPGGRRPAQLHGPEQFRRRIRRALSGLGRAPRQERLRRADAGQQWLARASAASARRARARSATTASAWPTPMPPAPGCRRNRGSRPTASRCSAGRAARSPRCGRCGRGRSRRPRTAPISAPRSRSIRAAGGSATPPGARGCRRLILIGRADDQASAATCQQMVAGARGRSARVEIHVYPGAHHDFDHPNRPLQVRTGLAFSVGRQRPRAQRHQSGRPRRRAQARAGVVRAIVSHDLRRLTDRTRRPRGSASRCRRAISSAGR